MVMKFRAWVTYEHYSSMIYSKHYNRLSEFFEACEKGMFYSLMTSVPGLVSKQNCEIYELDIYELVCDFEEDGIHDYQRMFDLIIYSETENRFLQKVLDHPCTGGCFDKNEDKKFIWDIVGNQFEADNLFRKIGIEETVTKDYYESKI